MKVDVRPAGARDREFVISTWSSSFKASHFAGLIWTDDWAAIMHPQIARILDRATTTTLMACEPSSPDFVYGFVAGDLSVPTDPIVHYVYVKSPYRRDGVATALLAGLGVDPASRFTYTCRTGVVRDLLSRGLLLRATWDPLVARYPREEGPDATHAERPPRRRRSRR